MAAASLAALAGNMDCDPCDRQVADDEESKNNSGDGQEKKKQQRDFDGLPITQRSSPSALDQHESPTSGFNIISKDGSIHLRRDSNQAGSGNQGGGDAAEDGQDNGHDRKVTAVATTFAPPTHRRGYMDGSFSSGVTHEIRPNEGCFVLKYSDTLLAIGTVDGLELYETRHYSQVFQIPTQDEVSAIQWLKVNPNAKRSNPNNMSSNNQSSTMSLSSNCLLPSQLLLAFGCLDGRCFVYLIDVELLEVDGAVSLLYSCRMNAQIRALDACCCHLHRRHEDSSGGEDHNHQQQRINNRRTKNPRPPPARENHRTIVIAVGDKSGKVTLISLDPRSMQHLETYECEHNESAILGLSIQEEKGWISRCTKGGHVAVYPLERGGSPTATQNATTGTTAASTSSPEGSSNRTFVVQYGKCLWETTREGPVLAVTFSHSGAQLALGGYDKTVALIDTSVWAPFRKFQMEGTINVISMDPLYRYIAVGCRDRSLTLFDSSTYMKIKGFQTNDWVTDVSWKPVVAASADADRRNDCGLVDIMAFRSRRRMVSVLSLQPIEVTNVHLSSRHGLDTALSWSADGRWLVRSHGATIFVVDADHNFQEVSYASFDEIVIQVLFCPAQGRHDRVAVVDESGQLTLLRLLPRTTCQAGRGPSSLVSLQKECAVMIEFGIKTMRWSPDGSVLALGGKQKLLHLFDSSSSLTKICESIKLDGRILDMVFCSAADSTINEDDVYLVLALGDYTCIALSKKWEVVLRFVRPRTARCLALHPRNHSILVVGDGTGTVAVVNTKAAEMVHEIKAGGGRINALAFSPVGDYLLVGTDDGYFNMYLDGLYQFAQQIPCKGFSICAQFSPDGAHLALGSAGGSYSIVRLGPFLGIDLVPLTLQRGTLPDWALAEVLYRSGYSASYLQRHIQAGDYSSDNIRRLSSLLKEYPTAVFAFDRSNNETFFDTALRMRRPLILKLAITAFVDGTLETRQDSSILKSRLPLQARNSLVDLVINMNPELASEILSDMVFLKVPYGKVRTVHDDTAKFEKSSPSTTDPWDSIEKDNRPDVLKMISWATPEADQHEKKLTPAVLPLPGLGDMEFLSALLLNASADVFANAAMGLVLRVLWTDHIRIFFYMDFFVCICFYVCWVALVESIVRSDSWGDGTDAPTQGLAIVAIMLNTLFGVKEMVEARLGRRSSYFKNFWNAADILSLVFVYAFVAYELLPGDSEEILIPLAVATTLTLTVKVISYLRGFEGTGWLISVLSANFTDVRGFLCILFAILFGFAVAFRILFSRVNEDAYGSLRRSFLSTFSLVTTGNFEEEILYDADWSVLAAITFVLAVTCVLVIALNALISILADSYARVQVNAVANRRREQAGLIVEYMTLLPLQSRKRLEDKTRWFHCLLEVDSDGALLLGKQDWQGGLNALRKDLEELSLDSREQYEKGMLQMKNELYTELTAFRKETLALLSNLTAEIQELKKAQPRGGITLNGRNVVNAVNAVRFIGEKTAKFIKNEGM